MSDFDEDRVSVEVPAHETDDKPKITRKRMLIWIAVIGVLAFRISTCPAGTRSGIW